MAFEHRYHNDSEELQPTSNGAQFLGDVLATGDSLPFFSKYRLVILCTAMPIAFGCIVVGALLFAGAIFNGRGDLWIGAIILFFVGVCGAGSISGDNRELSDAQKAGPMGAQAQRNARISNIIHLLWVIGGMAVAAYFAFTGHNFMLGASGKVQVRTHFITPTETTSDLHHDPL